MPVHPRKFWRSTSDGHIVRPVQMRPLRPLPPILIPKAGKQPAVKSNPFRPTKLVTKSSTALSVTRKKLLALSRARPTIIDPIRYGARHLPIPSAMNPAPRNREHHSAWEFDDEQQQWVEMSNTGAVLRIEEMKGKPGNKPSRPGGAFPSTASPVVRTRSESIIESNIEPLLPTAEAIVDTSRPISAREDLELPQPPTLSHSTPKDEISEQLASEKTKGLAIMRNLLANGWSVDLDELGDAHHAGPDTDIILRRASTSGSASSEQHGDEDQDNSTGGGDASFPGIAHAIFDDDATSDSESSDNYDGDNDDDVQMQSFRATSPARSTVIGNSASPVATKKLQMISPPRQSTPAPAPAPAPAAQTGPKSLKEMFAPREDEGARLSNSTCMGTLLNGTNDRRFLTIR